MKSKLQGYEEVDSEGLIYIFRSNFQFIMALNEVSEFDAIEIAEKVNTYDPECIRDVLIASLHCRDGVGTNEISMEDKKSIIEDFITLHGLQECCILAQSLITHSMIGSLKKKQIEENQTVSGMINGLLFSPWQNLKNHALLWAYVSMIFIALQCTTTKIYPLLTALN